MFAICDGKLGRGFHEVERSDPRSLVIVHMILGARTSFYSLTEEEINR